MRRRLVLFALVIILSASRVFAAAVVVQCIGTEGVTGTQVTNFGVNITGGNAIIFRSYINSGNEATISVSDATNGTYGVVADYSAFSTPPNRDLYIIAKRNLTGGFTQITITPSDAGHTFSYRACEVSGLDNAATPQTDSSLEGSATSHVMGGSATLTGTGLVVGVSVFGDGVDDTAGTGYTAEGDVTSVGGFFQRKIATFTGEQAAFTVSPATNATSIVALFVESTGGGGGGGRHRMLRGVGR